MQGFLALHTSQEQLVHIRERYPNGSPINNAE